MTVGSIISIITAVLSAFGMTWGIWVFFMNKVKEERDRRQLGDEKVIEKIRKNWRELYSKVEERKAESAQLMQKVLVMEAKQQALENGVKKDIRDCKHSIDRFDERFEKTFKNHPEYIIKLLREVVSDELGKR